MFSMGKSSRCNTIVMGISAPPESGNIAMQGINFLLDLAVYSGCTKGNLGLW